MKNYKIRFSIIFFLIIFIAIIYLLIAPETVPNIPADAIKI